MWYFSLSPSRLVQSARHANEHLAATNNALRFVSNTQHGSDASTNTSSIADVNDAKTRNGRSSTAAVSEIVLIFTRKRKHYDHRDSPAVHDTGGRLSGRGPQWDRRARFHPDGNGGRVSEKRLRGIPAFALTTDVIDFVGKVNFLLVRC